MSALKFREEGNKLYKSLAGNISTSLKLDRLNRAMLNYNRSYSISRTDEEISSVTKNLSMTYLYLASLQDDFHQSLYFHTEAAKHFLIAIHRGTRCKTQAWIDELYSTIYTRTFEVLEISKQLSPYDRQRWLGGYAKELPNCTARGRISSTVMRMIFKQSVLALDSKDFSEAAELLDECSYWIEETRRFGDSNLREVSEEYRNSVNTHMCLCESIRARKNAKALLEQSLHDKESLDMELVYYAIDTYKQSILFARDRDLECEAISLSKIGFVHYKVLKDNQRAGVYYAKCLEIAHSMRPRDMSNKNWYKQAFEGLRKIQVKQAQADDAEHEADKRSFYTSHSDILQEILNAFNKSVYDLLKHIYAKHSPKEDFILPELTSSNIQSYVKKAIVHYHPDKQSSKGENWKFLCEEIVKYLTSKYEVLKSST